MPEYPYFISAKRQSKSMSLVIAHNRVILFGGIGSYPSYADYDTDDDAGSFGRGFKILSPIAAKQRLKKHLPDFEVWQDDLEGTDDGGYLRPFEDWEEVTDKHINIGLRYICEKFGFDVVQLIGKRTFGFANVCPELTTGQQLPGFWLKDKTHA